MSSSFLNAKSARTAIAVAVGVGLSQIASAAADLYVIPEAELRAEHHSNIDVAGGDRSIDSEIDGYVAALGGTVGVRTLRGLTEFRPHLEYQNFPDRDELTETNAYFDLKSFYAFQRDNLSLVGHYSRENDVSAQIPEAEFDRFDPNNPSDSSNAPITLTSQITTRVQLRPEYIHSFTERVGAGITGLYQTVNFDSDTATTRRDNEFDQAEGFLRWKLDQRTQLRTGVYVAKFETDDKTSKTDATGLSMQLTRNWSANMSGFVIVNAERTDVEGTGTTKETSNSWGLTFGGYRYTPISRSTLSAGRSLSPSYSGARVTLDEFRAQYARDLTERLTWSTAVRTYRSKAQGRVNVNDNDFARADLELRWRMTPTIYIGGGYSYVWQEFTTADKTGHDNQLRVQIGYLGLPPQ
jgi:hypothetical protein